MKVKKGVKIGKWKRKSPKANKAIEKMRLEQDGESYVMPDLHTHRNKTHCLRGHEFNKENTYYDKKNYRHCKICRWMRKRKLRNEGELK